MTTNAEPTRRHLLGAGGIAAIGLTAPARAAGTAPEAKTDAGRVRGEHQNGILAFKGIRYGADTRLSRFQPPQKPKPWRGVADTTRYGTASPQATNEANQSEDCLFLNVWTPALRDNARRPVMFYIHGGAYAGGSGSAPETDGANLARRGNVVVVTINHRLNAFGYLYLGSEGPLPDSGNAGQLDIIAALQWVRENIAEFGGDPNCVMVFGQSGGGAKIATLMAMEKATGLFHRATTMSGQQLTASGPQHAAQRTDVYLKALGLDRNRLKNLTERSTEELVNGLKATDPIIGSGGVYFGPVLDMRNLLRHPFFPDAPAISTHIPMMIGNTHDETRAFIQADWAYNLTWEELPRRLAENMRVDILPAHVIAEYKKLYPGISASDLFFAATTASRSWRAAIEEDQARAATGCPAFAYQVNWRTLKEGGKLRAPHTIDIALAFDNTDVPAAITGSGPQASKMAAIVSECFIAFARTGHPDNSLVNGWKPYSLANRETMIFDLPPELVNDPRGAERRIFEKVPFIQQGT